MAADETKRRAWVRLRPSSDVSQFEVGYHPTPDHARAACRPGETVDSEPLWIVRRGDRWYDDAMGTDITNEVSGFEKEI